MLKKLWKDDAGIIPLEYLLVATLVGLASIVGLRAVAASLNIELTELANATLAISQQYSYCGHTGCCASTAGSATVDTATSIAYTTVAAPAATSINETCP